MGHCLSDEFSATSRERERYVFRRMLSELAGPLTGQCAVRAEGKVDELKSNPSLSLSPSLWLLRTCILLIIPQP